MARRILYSLSGAAIGAFAGYLLDIFGLRIPLSIPVIAFGLLALFWAERTRRVRTPAGLHRPVTLRDNDAP